MVSPDRIRDLKAFVAFWTQALVRAESQLHLLLDFQRSGATVTDEAANDILAARIAQEDIAVREYKKALTRSESLLGSAQYGEDV
jgi:hypothetical protein